MRVKSSEFQVVIHIGPPKTGTSAIQKWLNDHHLELLKHGFYYPSHKIDVNGVSSGNVRLLYDYNGKNYDLSDFNVQRLLKEVKAAGCHTLLLSSEFFFLRLEQLNSIFNDAVFVAYIRNPVEVFESNYNQGVKRHHEINRFVCRKGLPMKSLVLLQQYHELLGPQRLLLRSYHKKLFVGGGIVSDFLSILNLSHLVTGEDQLVNRGYSLEALEVKRWLNRYQLDQLLINADKILQNLPGEITRFTFVDRNQFNNYKRQSVHWLKRLYNKTHFYSGDKLIDIISKETHKPYYRQVISSEQCRTVLQYFLENSPVLLKRIALHIYGQPNVEDVNPFNQVLFTLLPPKQVIPPFWSLIKLRKHRSGLTEASSSHADEFRKSVAAYLEQPRNPVRYFKMWRLAGAR